jgi:hypothetical protein
VKWQTEDLRHVCEFLAEVEELKLLAKFAKQGTRKCPEVACFHWLTAMTEMAKGPIHYNRLVALDSLQRAIELASQSSDPRDKQVLANAKRALNLVEGASPHFGDDYDEDYDDDYNDDDDDFDEYTGGRYGDSMDGVSPEEVYDAIRTLCERFGLNPDGVLDELPDAGPKKSRRSRNRK